ncbi:hypothetical protein J437_LFUL001800 [Ladona fulva]|uniref:C2H2-type domain-containing protein n=1 Tax=Ladona fulva TaxID=123851 RepID=A0A8K0NW36_LADFU|nr:hypothetical protein J437_LFUL001800 [Ladona fulva]
MDKNRGNEALNIEITNYLPEGDLNTKEQMRPYTTHTMVGANGYSEGCPQKLNPSEMLSCTQGTTMTENCTSWRKGIKCYFCEKEFGFPSLLAQHIRVHTGVKPHTCNFCGKSFSTKGNLKSHFIIHTGEKPFKCHVCGKQFSYKGNLAVHYRTHSGERPFECSVCGKSFSAKSNLLIHHGIHYRDLYPNDESARLFAPLY